MASIALRCLPVRYTLLLGCFPQITRNNGRHSDGYPFAFIAHEWFAWCASPVPTIVVMHASINLGSENVPDDAFTPKAIPFHFGLAFSLCVAGQHIKPGWNAHLEQTPCNAAHAHVAPCSITIDVPVIYLVDDLGFILDNDIRALVSGWIGHIFVTVAREPARIDTPRLCPSFFPAYRALDNLLTFVFCHDCPDILLEPPFSAISVVGENILDLHSVTGKFLFDDDLFRHSTRQPIQIIDDQRIDSA